MHNKNETAKTHKDSFSMESIMKFDKKYNNIILEGIDKNKNKSQGHYANKETALINRILEYKTNYFMWIHDFSIPTNNNLSEIALKKCKNKNEGGQFQNINYTNYYADIKIYAETCYRNGINPTDALILLMEDKTLTVSDIIKNEQRKYSLLIFVMI